ncbi:peptidoglycan-recognition protein SC2-like isoform X4 [Anticarsia gemmatalis]|uniref:peptidoglycan-recognition protein SC2-like isoform X4 n=1 Tax=Anticarsia gemmatalis TaxID=129554 RepID=UPI003F76945F
MWVEPRQELPMTMGRSSAGSDVVMIDPATNTQPAVTNLNVTKSSRVHIGPKFVSVTQNVDNTEVVKGRILGLELVSPQNTKRLRCSIAVFVCWAFVVACALTFFIFHYALAKQVYRLDLDIREPWYLRRGDWQAMPEYGMELLDVPVRHVLIGHSALDYCSEKYVCIKKVLEIQSLHHRRGWADIGPNFLVSGNGLVFEGRGANLLGVMVKSWNRIGISIMFLGNYLRDQPTEIQFTNVNILLEELVRKRVLHPDYIMYGHCQVQGDVITPGPNLMDNLHNFDHWNPVNKTRCLRH